MPWCFWLGVDRWRRPDASVGVGAVGDEVLGAVEDVVVAVARAPSWCAGRRRRCRRSGSVRAKQPSFSPLASGVEELAASAPRCRTCSSGSQTSELLTDMMTPLGGAAAADLLDRQAVGDGVQAGAAVLLGHGDPGRGRARPPGRRTKAGTRPTRRSPCARGLTTSSANRRTLSRSSFCSSLSSIFIVGRIVATASEGVKEGPPVPPGTRQSRCPPGTPSPSLPRAAPNHRPERERAPPPANSTTIGVSPSPARGAGWGTRGRGGQGVRA